MLGQKEYRIQMVCKQIAPWDRIKKGETVYFKESGLPVSVKAVVSKIIQFENLNPKTVQKIIGKYGKKIAPKLSEDELVKWGLSLKDKRYVILVFLKDVRKIKVFDIDKSGYGIQSAWLCAGDVQKIKIRLLVSPGGKAHALAD